MLSNYKINNGTEQINVSVMFFLVWLLELQLHLCNITTIYLPSKVITKKLVSIVQYRHQASARWILNSVPYIWVDTLIHTPSLSSHIIKPVLVICNNMCNINLYTNIILLAYLTNSLICLSPSTSCSNQ